MSTAERTLPGKERTFPEDEIIVSKTDPKGRLTYVNDVFLTVSDYTEAECIGQPHSMIRHPDTPRAIFKLLWETISSGNEIFAYVNNRAKNGDHYWVFAHITPNFGSSGEIIGYHSNRRSPRPEALAKIQPLYDALLRTERAHPDRKQGLEASFKQLNDLLASKGTSYGEFIFDL